MRFHLLLRAVSHASACLSRRAHLPHASPRGGRRRRSTADSCWCATPRVSAEPEFMEAESEGEEEDEGEEEHESEGEEEGEEAERVDILLAVMSTKWRRPPTHGTWQSGVTGFDPRLAKPPDRKRSRGSILFSVLNGADEARRGEPRSADRANHRTADCVGARRLGDRAARRGSARTAHQGGGCAAADQATANRGRGAATTTAADHRGRQPRCRQPGRAVDHRCRQPQPTDRQQCQPPGRPGHTQRRRREPCHTPHPPWLPP